ncbi:hypothetical protein RND71_005250 [Anisodus tanguticus]|uniref:Uncharacterized protein n=1 Tax=Anisodus tanguticus TaxID=243964 RepID=A0AAE1VLB9_9SOLA|nr:hypothetical protein RND71_005250 [Anisodus tanguticus]
MFWVFLGMPLILVQGRLLHNLLIREVRFLDDDALHFVVSGAKLRFGLGEFARIIGLKYEKDDAFAYFGGLHMDCADLDVDENQGICGGDENVKDVKSNNGVGGSDSSKEVIGGSVVSESAIDVITQKYYIDKMVKMRRGDVESADADNESVDDGVAKGNEVPAKVEDTMKDCGVGPSGVSGGDCDSEEKVLDLVIPQDTNVVEINDDQTTLVAPCRGRQR